MVQPLLTRQPLAHLQMAQSPAHLLHQRMVQPLLTQQMALHLVHLQTLLLPERLMLQQMVQNLPLLMHQKLV